MRDHTRMAPGEAPGGPGDLDAGLSACLLGPQHGFCQGRLRVNMPLAGSGCPTVTDGLDRFRESQILLRRVGGRPPTFPPAYGRREAEPHRSREAEPHRSRTVSLGIGQIVADEDAEQPTSETRSSHDWPLMTLVNCTLIARRPSAFQTWPSCWPIRSKRGWMPSSVRDGDRRRATSPAQRCRSPV
jgi:hypothetical protein